MSVCDNMAQDDLGRIEKINVLFKLFEVRARAYYQKQHLKRPYQINRVITLRFPPPQNPEAQRQTTGRTGNPCILAYESIEGLEAGAHSLIAEKQAE